MASRLRGSTVGAIALLALVGSTQLALAQQPDPEPGEELSPPPPPDPPPDDPPPDPPPDDSPPDDPPPDPPPDDPSPSEPEPTSTSSDGSSAPEQGRRIPGIGGFMLGFGLGVGGATGEVGDIYRPGVGATLLAGIRIDMLSVEAQFGFGYNTFPTYDALSGRNSGGKFGTKSITVRWQLLGGDWRGPGLSVFGGVATATVPLLGAAPVSTIYVDGTGLAGGVAIVQQLSWNLQLSLDLAGHHMWWELPGRSYVKPAAGAGSSDASIGYSAVSDDVTAIPWTVVACIRVVIGKQ